MWSAAARCPIGNRCSSGCCAPTRCCAPTPRAYARASGWGGRWSAAGPSAAVAAPWDRRGGSGHSPAPGRSALPARSGPDLSSACLRPFYHSVWSVPFQEEGRDIAFLGAGRREQLVVILGRPAAVVAKVIWPPHITVDPERLITVRAAMGRSLHGLTSWPVGQFPSIPESGTCQTRS